MDDLISRQAAIDAVEKESQVDGAYGYMDTKSIIDLLCELPSAQQDCTECEEYDHKTKSCPCYCDVIRKTVEEAKQERTGRWILSDTQRQEDVDNGNYQFICSECGKADIHSKAVAVSFCWNCGARMEENNETD